MPARLPRLPQLLDRKIYKTGQTRGADDDVIYQNRVSRTSTVLIPYAFYESCIKSLPNGSTFENGFIVLISPATYFETQNIKQDLASKGLELGKNLLVFYETREQWNLYNPVAKGWTAAESRTSPLKGSYVARVPATTATANGGKIIEGFSTTSNKGAGIRVYEYASTTTISDCRCQLEVLFWLCFDSIDVVTANGMDAEQAATRRKAVIDACTQKGLLDRAKLVEARMLNKDGVTICPLCLEPLSSKGFFSRLEQAEGRDVPDLTVTQLNLFHIEELRIGVLNHKPYNLGWGHHHCNVVVKDSGILETIEWMNGVIEKNISEGLFRRK